MHKVGAIWRTLPVAVQALLLQGVAFVVLLALARGLPALIPPPYPLWGWALAQGGLAALLSWRAGLARWWLIIQLLFPPLLWLALAAGVPWWGVAAVLALLWLVFRNALSERVPLYLSNRTTWRALCRAADTLQAPVRFMDLGCGWGGVVHFMGAHCPAVVRSAGVETAPLNLWVARQRVGEAGEVHGVSLWETPLGAFNMVYAFLSPAPMARLSEKVRAEMPPRSLFVSNSFPLPDCEATEIWQLNDRRGTLLYLYYFDAERRLVPPREVCDGDA